MKFNEIFKSNKEFLCKVHIERPPPPPLQLQKLAEKNDAISEGSTFSNNFSTNT